MAKAAVAVVHDKTNPLVEQYAQLFTHGLRTPVLRTPNEVGLDYEECWFPSADGVTLEAWYIPAEGSDKLLIANHPMPCNRYGFPGHLPPYNTMFGGFEVNFLPELKHLHDAGYNILTYDIRNHGRSGAGSGGLSGIGLLECRDVLGSMRYAQTRPDTKDMHLGLYSRCMGSNSTMVAVAMWPDAFASVEAAVFLQPAPGAMLVRAAATHFKLDADKTEQRVADRIYELSGFHLADLSPTPSAHAVTFPTLVAQLERDWLIDRNDIEEIYNHLDTVDKDLFWIPGSDQRFSGYNYFGQHPERLVGWFDTHMKA
ncbi:alpha/beta hydrolase [Gordonia sp. TBRC 11910]|uniref:Alpha/beta hydrolase n=2 Tax=Gordonia asplenii TaxID=2725283 RepID=A0A848KY94_9ACTN|nr:alpha/beta hydrolase [Gordonia asplenii]